MCSLLNCPVHCVHRATHHLAVPMVALPVVWSSQTAGGAVETGTFMETVLVLRPTWLVWVLACADTSTCGLHNQCSHLLRVKCCCTHSGSMVPTHGCGWSAWCCAVSVGVHAMLLACGRGTHTYAHQAAPDSCLDPSAGQQFREGGRWCSYSLCLWRLVGGTSHCRK